MTEKRFTIIGTQIGRVIRDNETDINTGDIGIIFDWLNELAEENTHIKNTIKEAYTNERTQLGKSVLKQLIEAIQ